MKLFFSDDYVAAGHSFDTTRKAQWIVKSLLADPLGFELTAPRPLSVEELIAVHDAGYVNAVRTGRPDWLATSQGFDWDPGLWRAVCASNGGAVAAAVTALDEGRAGSLSSGMHHARRGEGRGFCTFNGLVLGAEAAFAKGAERVVVLDLDAHCGGGTHELTAGDRRIVHLDVAVSSFDSYRPDGVRQRLAIVRSAHWYLAAVAQMLDSVKGQVDLVIYNAGMDPFEKCLIGGLPGVTRSMLQMREAMVMTWASERDIPLAFVLAGGYTGGALSRRALVSLHRLTLDMAVHVALPHEVYTDPG
ncbi:MAG: hypothetical protein ACR2MY_02055 [Candidatus Dormibacteria bacterium]